MQASCGSGSPNSNEHAINSADKVMYSYCGQGHEDYQVIGKEKNILVTGKL